MHKTPPIVLALCFLFSANVHGFEEDRKYFFGPEEKYRPYEERVHAYFFVLNELVRDGVLTRKQAREIADAKYEETKRMLENGQDPSVGPVSIRRDR